MPGHPAVLLFKIVTVRDEIVIGLSPAQLAALGGGTVDAVGRALSRGALTAWQFVVRRRDDGVLEQAPLREVSILGRDRIRVEPYITPLPIVPIAESAKRLWRRLERPADAPKMSQCCGTVPRLRHSADASGARLGSAGQRLPVAYCRRSSACACDTRQTTSPKLRCRVEPRMRYPLCIACSQAQ